MSLDGIPYIGHYCARTPELFVASGFQKWGMTGSMTAARLLCDQVLGIQRCVFTEPQYDNAAALGERMGGNEESSHTDDKAMPASWLRAQVERRRTHVGLSVSRLTF